ncbi:MAG: pyridoxamine 5'-phosphate oxidase family protein [Parvularculales bacterium]
MNTIKSVEELRALYPPLVEGADLKQLSKLDGHMRKFISMSPFMVMATYGEDELCDSTPRGGTPGFVAVESDRLLLLPDWPGNNRLDSFENILKNSGVGLLFLIPGVNETLRINGKATISVEKELRERFITKGKLPRTVVCIEVVEAYIHCAKALMRSQLWGDAHKIDRDKLPSMGQMMKDQIGFTGEPEPQAETEEQYKKFLY